MRLSKAIVFLLLASAARARNLDAPGLSDRVVCRDDPAQAYALLLPPGYAPDRPAPVLYLLDARGRALLAIERFRPAAERFGWILAASYNSRSDTGNDPNTPALRAMWKDTHARVSIDPRRVYLGGFSGGARAAVALGQEAPRAVAGVIGCGAGLPEGMAPRRLTLPYFATAGDRDFNYYEMRALDADLTRARAPHRIVFFAGVHDWPPASSAGRAVAWMELTAMRAGTRAPDAPLVERLLADDLAAAAALERAGAAAEAQRAYAEAAEDYRGLADVSGAAERSRSLADSPDVRRALRDAERRDARDRGALRRFAETLRSASRDPDVPPAAALASELGIPALKARAASGPPEERLSAERLLAHLRVETSFYLPEELLARGDAAHARLMLSVAAEIDPEDPRVDYSLASADARTGKIERARRELERAVDKGFRRFDMLETDPDLEALRRQRDFPDWLAATRRRASAAPTPTRPPP